MSKSKNCWLDLPPGLYRATHFETRMRYGQGWYLFDFIGHGIQPIPAVRVGLLRGLGLEYNIRLGPATVHTACIVRDANGAPRQFTTRRLKITEVLV